MDKGMDRLDMILANMKAIEPSLAFDAAFKSRLSAVIAGRYEEKPVDRMLRNLKEAAFNLRNVLVPEARLLVRVVATFVVVVSVGLYIYSQPSCPALVGQEGSIMVMASDASAPKEIGPAHKFRAGDTIIIAKESQLDMGLADKYAIRVKGGSRLKIAKLTPRYGNGKAEFNLVEGRVLVSVEEGFKGSSLVVDTKSATATALGTKFAVDASGGDDSRTEVSVLQGKVEVKSSYRPGNVLLAKRTVVVDSGQKTDVAQDAVPASPVRLMESEWLQLEELYQIGKKPQVMLLVKNTPDRVKQLLGPCPVYISDEKPREIPPLMEKALLKIAEAVKSRDAAKHLESIKMLEQIIAEYPNHKYDLQLLLYIGAYYEYLGYHEDAIRTFEEAVLKYPDLPLSSMAQAAIGFIYEEKLGDAKRANAAYGLVLRKYPNSLEAIWAEEKLGIKKSG